MTLPELRMLAMSIYRDIDTTEIALGKLGIEEIGDQLFVEIIPALFEIRAHTDQVVSTLVNHIRNPT